MKVSEYWNLVKMFFKVKKEINTMSEDKPGWKSTAGILNILSIILTVYGGFDGMISAELSAKITAMLVMVFTMANAIVKFTSSKKDNEILEKIAKLLEDKIGVSLK